MTATGGVADAQTLPPGKMRDTVWAACNCCHPVTRFTGMRKARAGWVLTMNRNKNTFVVIDDDEDVPLIYYHTENFRPQK